MGHFFFDLRRTLSVLEAAIYPPPLVYFVALLNVGWLALGFGVCADTHL